MKSKKGALSLSLKEMIEIILLSVILVTFLIPVTIETISLFTSDVDKDLKRSLNRLVTEMEDLKNDIKKHGKTNPYISVPIDLEKNAIIMTYEPNSELAPRKCKKKSCICAFQEIGDIELSTCKKIKGVQLENTQTIIGYDSGGVTYVSMTAEEINNKIIIQIT